MHVDIHSQRSVIEDFASQSGLSLISAHEEVEAEANPDEGAARPGLAKALSEARKRKCPLIVAKFEHLADDITSIAQLMTHKVPFIIADPSGNAFVVRLFSAPAFRKPLAGNAKGRKRALEAMALARAAQVAAADQQVVDTMPIVRDLQAQGMTTMTAIAAELNRVGVATTRGGRWHASTVRNLINRSIAKTTLG